MISRRIIIQFIFWFFFSQMAWAQTEESPKDSTKVYREIEEFSKKNKYYKFIHSLIFKPVSPVPPKKKKNIKKQNKNYKKAEKRIIRNIDITTLDPFGLNINDTAVQPKFFLQKTGNKIHVKTRKIIVKNLLLFKKNDVFDSLIIKESERLIRSQSYIRDVKFQVNLIPPDSVDIVITVQDLWSIRLNGSLSASKVGINIKDRNFAGLGYQLQHVITKYKGNGTPAFETNYFINNIRNTFINSNIHYKVNEDDSYLKRFSVSRSFFSSFTRWAGGVLFEQEFHSDSLLLMQNIFQFQNVKYNRQDYWLGKAWPLEFANDDYSRTTNFIASSRYMHLKYLQKPDTIFVSAPLFKDENLFLVSLGVNTRLYLQDRYIFNYGLTEDVPTGKAVNLTIGYQSLGKSPRWYSGLKIAWGDYYEWGYFSNKFEYGTFINKNRFEQGAISNEITYFTSLKDIGRWNFRQFIKPTVLIGLYRHSNDYLYINDDSLTISAQFDHSQLSWTGKHRLMLTLQTQSYAPWNVLGFHFGPFLSISLAMLSDKSFSLKNNNLFTQIDIGILVRNEFLLFNYFQLSFTFNPIMPDGKRNAIRFNAYETFDFGLGGFDVGKPSTITYR